jgi:hypothetical protein
MPRVQQLTFREVAYRRDWTSHLDDCSIELNTLSLFTNLPPTPRRAWLLKQMSFCFGTRDDDFCRGMIQAHSFHTALWKFLTIPRVVDLEGTYPFTMSGRPWEWLGMGAMKFVDWESMIVWVSASELTLSCWRLPIARGMLGFDILHPDLPRYASTPAIRLVRHLSLVVSPLVHRYPFKPLDLTEGAYGAPTSVAPPRHIGFGHHILVMRDPLLAALPWERQIEAWEWEERDRRRFLRSRICFENIRRSNIRRSDVSDNATLVEENEEGFQPQEF